MPGYARDASWPEVGCVLDVAANHTPGGGGDRRDAGRQFLRVASYDLTCPKFPGRLGWGDHAAVSAAL